MRPVGCAVLAAGASRRLVVAKQLVPYEGVPLVRRGVETALASSCDDVTVIVGHAREDVEAALVGLSVEIVYAAAWREGMGRSVRTAAQWAERRRLSALVLLACDQPLLTSRHVDALVAEHSLGAQLVASLYNGVRGVPALFDASWFDRLVALEGDRGAGTLLRGATEAVAIPWADGAFDVDEQCDLERLRGLEERTAQRTCPRRAT